MRIDMDLQPLGPDRMRERMQEILAKTGGDQPAFQLPQGPSGLSGSLAGAGIAPFNPVAAGLQPDGASAKLRAMIEDAANAYGVDPDLLDALVATESSYDPKCRSRAGAMGLTQLMPENVRELGISQPFDPKQNLEGGARQLSQLLAKYPGRLDLALAAYNAGPGAVAKYGGIPPFTETQNYVQKVLGLYNLKRSRP